MQTDSYKSLDLTDKSLIVTGAGSGIGRASAQLFAARGANVMVSDINEQNAKETAQQIESDGGRAAYLRTDVSVEEEVEALVHTTVEKFGGLHGAFNNAGIGPQSPLHETSAEDWYRTIGINLTGVFFCMKHEIAYLLEHGGGSIVNTASLAGYKSVPGMPAYVASKHGVVGLTRAATQDYASRNIRVNVILPGTIATPMLESVLHDPRMAQAMADGQPMGHVGNSIDIAEQAAWLLSDAAKFSAGSLFFVDGGSNAI